MQNIKKLTRAMKKELVKCKIKPDKYGYIKNTPELIEVVNRETGDIKIIYKSDYNFSF